MEVIHEFEELARRDRPQDPRRDGGGLRFRTRKHAEGDSMPEEIRLRDAIGRTCIYVQAKLDGMKPETRPQDLHRNGSGLRFETLRRGGEFDDDMPRAIRVTDQEGRSCLYEAPCIDGKGVVSKGMRIVDLMADPNGV